MPLTLKPLSASQRTPNELFGVYRDGVCVGTLERESARRMKVENTTNIPTEEIRQIIRAVRPPGISKFDVRVTNTTGLGGCGAAYHDGSSYHSRACPHLVVRVAKTEAAARFRWGRGRCGRGYLAMTTGSRREVLVMVLAHELRHLWQAKVKRGRRVWGSRGQFSERDADAYALRMLRAYRRGELVSQGRLPQARIKPRLAKFSNKPLSECLESKRIEVRGGER